jgi:hypothetical protein
MSQLSGLRRIKPFPVCFFLKQAIALGDSDHKRFAIYADDLYASSNHQKPLFDLAEYETEEGCKCYVRPDSKFSDTLRKQFEDQTLQEQIDCKNANQSGDSKDPKKDCPFHEQECLGSQKVRPFGGPTDANRTWSTVDELSSPKKGSLPGLW